MKLRLEKRLETRFWTALPLRVVAILLAIGLAGILLALTGRDPVAVYAMMVKGAFGSKYGVSETIVKSIPIMLCALGLGLAFRMKVWNIGAEGQLYLGAWAGTAVALYWGDHPGVSMVAMLAAGFLAGALWAILAVLPHAFLGINEVITTLMFNYIAILFVPFFTHGAWRDPEAFNVPITKALPPESTLPTFANTRVHLGLLLALVAAVALMFLIHNTKFGFQVRVIGESRSAARYAGMGLRRNIILAMLISGGLAGLAGISEVSGVMHHLQDQVSPGYGYTAIIVAFLARLNPLATVLVSILFGGLLVGGYAVQLVGVPDAVSSMLQGTILFFVLWSEFFLSYRVRLDFPERTPDAGA
jgi:ABC-type uncharacterized transport system permease subunit